MSFAQVAVLALAALCLAASAAEPPKAPEPILAPADLAPPPDVAAPPADAETTASGLATKVLAAGSSGGARPVAADSVKVHYTGWTTDGKMFDSSVARGKPTVLPLDRVIPGWRE